MPRNMSFMMTTRQFKARSKDITRRFGWWDAKPGDIYMAVEKGMGLKKGEKMNRLGLIRVVSVRKEPLNAMEDSDCAREGFPEMNAAEFVDMLSKSAKKHPSEPVNRIEYEYL